MPRNGSCEALKALPTDRSCLKSAGVLQALDARGRPVTRRTWQVLSRIAAGLLTFTLSIFQAGAETLRGSALSRERMAPPDGLTFEAVIEDISRTGAPAQQVAATRFKTRGQPPYAFELHYDVASIGPRGDTRCARHCTVTGVCLPPHAGSCGCLRGVARKRSK